MSVTFWATACLVALVAVTVGLSWLNRDRHEWEGTSHPGPRSECPVCGRPAS